MFLPTKNCFDISGLQPLGICVYTNHPYFMEQCAMTGGVNYIGDDIDSFNDEFKNHWSGEKGLCYNISCWEVLQELRRNREQWAFIDYHHKPTKNVLDAIPDEFFKMMNPYLYVLHKSDDQNLIPNLMDYHFNDLEKELQNGCGKQRLEEIWTNVKNSEELKDLLDEHKKRLNEMSLRYFGQELSFT
jgi:hypothetical protein